MLVMPGQTDGQTRARACNVDDLYYNVSLYVTRILIPGRWAMGRWTNDVAGLNLGLLSIS